MQPSRTVITSVEQTRAALAASKAVASSMPTTTAGRMALRPIDLVVIHCSATRSGGRLAGQAEAVIDGWHRQRGFLRSPGAARRFNPSLPSIGYHYVIDVDGRIATGRGLAEVGAHVAGVNARSVGVCLVGGAEPRASYGQQQWAALSALVLLLTSELGIALQHVSPAKLIGVCGHRDLSPDLNQDGRVQPREWLKTCPGFDVSTWLAEGMVPLPGQVLEGGLA